MPTSLESKAAKPLRELSLSELVALRNKIASDPANLAHPDSKRIYKPRVTFNLYKIRRVIKKKMEMIALARGEKIDFSQYTGIDIPMLKSDIHNCESDA